MAMSDEHKAALAEGRRQAAAIRRYLTAVGGRRPGRPVTPTSIRARIAKVEKQLQSDPEGLEKVQLVQQRIDLEEALEKATAAADIAKLEKGFVKHASGYSKRKGISYAAWREVGVPASVLKQAGITRRT